MFRIKLFISAFFLLCSGTLFLSSSHFVNPQMDIKWYCFYFGVPVIIGLGFFIFAKEDFRRLAQNQLLIAIIPLCCFIQSLYGIGQFLGWFQSANGFRVTGSFDNPAGFAACLSAGAPFFWYFILKNNPIGKLLTIITLTTVGLAIAFSASRAGIISFLLVLLLVGLRYLSFDKTKKILLSVILLSGLLVGLYFLKKDSADGRILIGQCSWEMIKDKPMLGFGPGGFKANYMNYQADYFASHQDSRFSMLADNIDRPFNEYISLLVNYGLLGLTVLLVLILFLWKTYRNNPQSLLNSIAGWCLLSIGVFALFSYPLTYSFVWVVGLTSIFIIMYPKLFYQKVYAFGIPFALLLIVIVFYFGYTRMHAEMQWCDIANKSRLGQTEKMLPQYKILHNQLRKNRLFLYNYAAELNIAGHYEESLRIGYECEKIWADYDLQMLIANNYLQYKQYKQAENHYRKASFMCPVKFTPFYRLYHLYGITGDKENELKMANYIIIKPVKVMSPAILQMKQEVKSKKMQ